MPGYLSDVPDDPFDGQRIRLMPTDDGIVIYSVGENMTDDGGQVVPQPGKRLGQDFGFRLLNPQLRGLELLDDPSARK